MAQFVSFDPNTKVRGTTLLTYIAAMGEGGRAALEKHGLVDIQPDSWYSLQALLDVFRDVDRGDFSSVLDLVHIGMRIPEHALWPPAIQTVEDAFFSIDEAYHMNHKDGDIGHYFVELIGEDTLKVIAENPYPCDFDYGLLYAIAKHYLPEGKHLVVEHDTDAPCRKHGDASCTYHVSW